MCVLAAHSGSVRQKGSCGGSCGCDCSAARGARGVAAPAGRQLPSLMRPRTCSSPSALALACAVCACGAWLLPRPAAAILSWEEHLEEVNRPRPQRLRRFLENVLVRTGAPRQVPPPPLNDGQ